MIIIPSCEVSGATVTVSPDRPEEIVGRFVAIVGPSGAGKDSLIDAARAHFGEDGSVRFARRCITRPADAGGEDHIAMTSAEFEAARARGEFCMSWDAHGLSYGIPQDVSDSVRDGRTVLANLSRGAIPELRRRFPRRRIIVVTASPEILARRLSARGRESVAEIEARLKRAPPEFPAGPDVITILNDRALEDAAAALIGALT